MYSPVHATTGLLIALAIPHPLIGLPLAIASHYVLDAIPHGDSGFGPWLKTPGYPRRVVIVEGLDLGTAALMVTWLVITHPAVAPWYLISGAIGGISPDLLWGASFLLSKLPRPLPLITRFLNWHNIIHTWGHAKEKYDLPFRAGLVYQGVILAVVLGWPLLK